MEHLIDLLKKLNLPSFDLGNIKILEHLCFPRVDPDGKLVLHDQHTISMHSLGGLGLLHMVKENKATIDLLRDCEVVQLYSNSTHSFNSALNPHYIGKLLESKI